MWVVKPFFYLEFLLTYDCSTWLHKKLRFSATRQVVTHFKDSTWKVCIEFEICKKNVGDFFLFQPKIFDWLIDNNVKTSRGYNRLLHWILTLILNSLLHWISLFHWIHSFIEFTLSLNSLLHWIHSYILQSLTSKQRQCCYPVRGTNTKIKSVFPPVLGWLVIHCYILSRYKNCTIKHLFWL